MTKIPFLKSSFLAVCLVCGETPRTKLSPSPGRSTRRVAPGDSAAGWAWPSPGTCQAAASTSSHTRCSWGQWTLTELAKKVCLRLRDLATSPSGGITQPRKHFFGLLCIMSAKNPDFYQRCACATADQWITIEAFRSQRDPGTYIFVAKTFDFGLFGEIRTVWAQKSDLYSEVIWAWTYSYFDGVYFAEVRIAWHLLPWYSYYTSLLCTLLP